VCEWAGRCGIEAACSASGASCFGCRLELTGIDELLRRTAQIQPAAFRASCKKPMGRQSDPAAFPAAMEIDVRARVRIRAALVGRTPRSGTFSS